MKFAMLSSILLAPFLLLAGSALASPNRVMDTHNLAKRDPSGDPANVFTEGCSLKNLNFGDGHVKSHADPGIQVGECYINSRVMGQKFCTFEPVNGKMEASAEGGPYGLCTCYDQFPKTSDLMSFKNLNYACLLWTKKDKVSIPPTLPGDVCIPFPVVCPLNLKGCYAANYFTPNGPASLMATAKAKPTCKMYWKSNKNANGDFMYCDHLQPACKVLTNAEFQTKSLLLTHKDVCDLSKCEPYQGSFETLTPAMRASYTVPNGVDNPTIAGKTPVVGGGGQSQGYPVGNTKGGSGVGGVGTTKGGTTAQPAGYTGNQNGAAGGGGETAGSVPTKAKNNQAASGSGGGYAIPSNPKIPKAGAVVGGGGGAAAGSVPTIPKGNQSGSSGGKVASANAKTGSDSVERMPQVVGTVPQQTNNDVQSPKKTTKKEENEKQGKKDDDDVVDCEDGVDQPVNKKDDDDAKSKAKVDKTPVVPRSHSNKANQRRRHI